MKRRHPLLVTFVACAIIGAVEILRADTAAVSPINGTAPAAISTPSAGTYEGSVSQVNSDGFTITTRYSAKTITVRTADNTTYNAADMLLPRDLSVGEKIFVAGNIEKSDNTIAAKLVVVNPNGVQARHPRAEAKRAGITGTIATMQPTTVTGDDGQTYTLKFTGKMVIWSSGAASPSDIEVGKGVKVTGESNGDFANEIVTASQVTILNTPQGARRFRGKLGKKKIPNVAPIAPVQAQ